MNYINKILSIVLMNKLKKIGKNSKDNLLFFCYRKVLKCYKIYYKKNINLLKVDKFSKNCYSLGMVERNFMNNNIDVLKQLEVKNKEIYLNKLNIDLDNNLDILSITIANITNLFANEMINKILEIEGGIFNKNKISTCVISFHEKIKDQLIAMFYERKTKLEETLKDIDNINYKEMITKETELIISKIDAYYNDNINNLCNEIGIDYDEFNLKRLSDYLKINYYEKFMLKIKECLNNTNIILINNYNESYKKFQELNEKTLK